MPPKRKSSPGSGRATRSTAKRKPASPAKEEEAKPAKKVGRTVKVVEEGEHPPDVAFFPDDIHKTGWYEKLAGLDTFYGKALVQSRAIAAYATEKIKVKYSGTEIDVHTPFPPIVQEICARVEAQLGESFNHVMLNRYDDGSVYIGRHSDTAENGIIAAVSLGAERRMVFTPRLPPRTTLSAAEKRDLEARKSFKMVLKNGSLLVMRPPTQDYWKHEVPREPACKQGRISLTFRQLPPAT